MWCPGIEHRHAVWWQPLICNKRKSTYFSIRCWCCGAGIKEFDWFCWGWQWEETLKVQAARTHSLKDETIPPPAPPSLSLSLYLCLQTWYPSRPRLVWLTFCVPAKNISTHILLFWSPALSALIYCTLPCRGNNQGFPSLSRDELFLLTAQLRAKAQKASL